MYRRYQGLVRWEEAAQNYELWKQHLNRFLDVCCRTSEFTFFFFFFLPRLFNREKVQRYRAVLLGSLQAQTVFILASLRCACGREGISPDLPLPGWEATARHSWAGEGEEVAEGWKVSVEIVVRGEILKQQAGSEGGGCCMGKDG